MTPPREPFFKAGSFFSYGATMDAHEACNIANRLVEPLIQELLDWKNGTRTFKCFECGSDTGPMIQINYRDEVKTLKDENERLRADAAHLRKVYAQRSDLCRVAFDTIRELRGKLGGGE